MSDSSKKSDHKHEYELVKIDHGWFTHERKCKICDHVNNRLAIHQ